MRAYTYQEIVDSITKIANCHDLVCSVYADELYMAANDVAYPVFTYASDGITSSSSIITYLFTFRYAERMNNTRSNYIQAQSTGHIVLGQVINEIKRLLDVSVTEWSYVNFSAAHADEVAGCTASVSFVGKAPLGDCSHFCASLCCECENTNT